MTVMNTLTVQPTNSVSCGNVPAMTVGGQSVHPGAVSPAGAMNANSMGSSMGISTPHQSGIGIKPGIQTPHANVLQVQEDAAGQQQPRVDYGKLNPGSGVPTQNMAPPQVRAVGHLGAGQAGGNLLPMEQWQPGGAAQGLKQQGPGTRVIQQQRVELQKLMNTLRTPQSPEQLRQLVAILKSNPQLMAAFIKQRQAIRALQGTGTGMTRQQFQHMLGQQKPGHQNRMQMQRMLGQGSGQGPTLGPQTMETDKLTPN